jgi:DNA-binding response OmpR family regulator
VTDVLLCVDDDPKIRLLLDDYFTPRGYHVITAATGAEAFLQAVRWPPAAVILDVFLPRPGGLATLERLRRLDPGVPVILISGVPNALDMLTEAGVEATAAFTKPVELEELAAALSSAGVPPAGGPPGPLPPPAPLRALVVDDEPEVRALLSDYLREQGIEPLGVWDGEEALRRIPAFRPHLILLDVLLPGLSGVDTLRRLRGLAAQSCVIMVSGHDDVETAERALQLGALEYLKKPVDLTRLDALLGFGRGPGRGARG